jgi:hypothetical protein
MDSIRRLLPPVYSGFVDEFFDRPKVVETRAECGKCVMCDHGQPSPVAMDYFNKETKCCTFFPQLPNYLVGAILADPSPEMEEGKKRIREVIANRMGTLPWILTRPRKLAFLMSNYGEAFGRSKSLLCPYFDSANPEYACTIWRHRETVCLTYYCKYNGGKRGYDFWTALKDYLNYTQRVLARAAAEAVDPKVVEPLFKQNQITARDMDDLPPTDADYSAWWGNWVGREDEFYVKTFEWVKAISRADFKQNVDESAEGKPIFERLVRAYDRQHDKILPLSLVRNGRMKEQHVDDKVVVTTYHRYDSFALDKELYDVVGLFKADQSLKENLARLEKEEGIELAPDLIEYLFAAGILVEPTPAVVATAAAPPKELEAELRGRRTALRAVLDARSIALDEADGAKVDAADAKTLDQWIAKAAVATTFAEVQEGT